MRSKQDVIEAARRAGSTSDTFRGAYRYLRTHPQYIAKLGSHSHTPMRGSRKTTRAAWYATEHRRRLDARNERIAYALMSGGRYTRRWRKVVPLWDRQRYETEAASLCALFGLPTRQEAAAREKLDRYPVYARAYYITADMRTPTLSAYLAEIEAAKGQLVESPTVARHSERTYGWGLLRTHETGESVVPQSVGVRQTGSNSDWNKRSTLRRRANYCLIRPTTHGPIYDMWYVASDKTERRVLRSRNYIQIQGESPVKLTVKPAAPKLARAAVRLLVDHGYDAYIERVKDDVRGNLDSRICIGRGEDQYHLSSSMIDLTRRDGKTVTASVLAEAERAALAIRKRQTERRLNARNAELDRIVAERKASLFVEVADSLAVGNCESMTMAFARQMWQQIGADAPAAVRVDVVLAARNDSYTQRACRVAALRVA